MVSRSIILGITYLIRLTKRPKGSGRTGRLGSVLAVPGELFVWMGNRFPIEGNMTWGKARHGPVIRMDDEGLGFDRAKS
jgi:hypothetical protein